ncbi:DUF3857 domain-containing protein [bacterium]|nr:DUF3857 domain-containing protein [bacterium]
MKKLYIVLIALILGVGSFADTIYLKNGKEFKCDLISIDKDTVKVVLKLDGTEQVYKKSELNKIKLDRTRRFDDVKNINEIDDKDIIFAFNAMLNRENFPNSNFIKIIQRKEIDLSGEFPVIVEKYVYKVLNKDGIRGASSHTEAYFKDSQDFSLDFALSVSPTGKVETIYENLIEDETRYARMPDYINSHNVKFSIPNVEPGYIVAYQVTRKYRKGSEELPFVKDVVFEGTVPSLNQFVTIWGNDSWNYRIINKGKFKKTVKDGKTTFFYTFPKEYTDTRLVSPYGRFAPRILFYAGNDPKVFSDQFNKVINDRNEADFEAFVKKIDFENNDPEYMMKRVFRFLQNSYTHIPVGPGQYKYAPRPMETLLKKGEFSAYEKTILAQAILSYLKVPTSVILASHVYAKVDEKEKFNFRRYTTPILKTASSKTPYIYFGNILQPFGIIPELSYGHRYFDITNNSFGTLPPLEQAEYEFSNTIELTGNIGENGELAGTLKFSSSMLQDQDLRAIRYRKEEEIAIIFQNIINSHISGASLKGLDIQNYEGDDEKVTVKIDFTAPGFANIAGENILFNIPLISFNGYDVGNDKRDLPVYLGAKDYTKYMINITLPEGYVVTYTPKDIKFCNKNLSIISNTEVNGSEISIVLQEETKKSMAKKKFYFKYKKAMTKLVKFSKSVIIGEEK